VPAFIAKVHLQRPGDPVARNIGVKEIEGFALEGEQVSFAHDREMVLGRLHAIDRTSDPPTIIVRLSPGE